MTNQHEPETQRHRGDLVKLLQVDTEFEAHMKAAVLHDRGIEAQVISDGASWAGMLRLGPMEYGASVWIQADDLEDATEALQQNVADSVDLDWDEVDVGQLEEEGEFTSRKGMPIPARFAFVVALLMMLFGLMLAIAMILG